MTALIIVLSILALLCFLLFMPVGINLRYDGDFNIRATYLFFRYKLKLDKEKKKTVIKKSKSKEPLEEEVEEKLSFFSELRKEKGVSGLIRFLKEFLLLLKGAAGKLTDHLIINKLYVRVSVSAENAADTAMHYGYACAGVYPLITAIQALVKETKKTHVEIAPDFSKTKTEIFAEGRATVKLYFLLGIVLRYGYKTLILFMHAKDPTPEHEV